MPSIVVEEAIKFIFEVVLAGVFAAWVTRLSKTRIERSDEHASKLSAIIEKMATAHDTTLEHVEQLQDDLAELNQKRQDCHKEIIELRRVYSADIERLNGRNDQLAKENEALRMRVNVLSEELQKITDPKVK